MRYLFALMAMMAVLNASLVTANERPPVHFVIAVGDLAADTRARATDLIDAATASIRPGDRVTLFSLVDQQTLGRIIVPPGRPLTERSRERRYGDERDAMKRALTARLSTTSSPSRWPQGLAELGKIIEPGVTDRRVHVALIDSTLYHDPAEPRVSMRTAYPNGALIRASMALSPFGTAERAKRLTGISVHFCHREEPKDFMNDQHQRLVEGAIATFVTAQGGLLASFTSAWADCRARFLTADQAGSIAAPPPAANEAPAMVIVRPRLANAKPAPVDTPVVMDAPARTPVVTAPTQPTATEAAPVSASPQVADAAVVPLVATPLQSALLETTPATASSPLKAAAKQVAKATPHRVPKRRVAKARDRHAAQVVRAQSPYVWFCDPLTGQMVLRANRIVRDF